MPAHTHAHTHATTHARTHSTTHHFTRIHTRMHARTCTHTRMHTTTHTFPHSYTRKHAHTHIHTHTCTRTRNTSSMVVTYTHQRGYAWKGRHALSTHTHIYAKEALHGKGGIPIPCIHTRRHTLSVRWHTEALPHEAPRQRQKGKLRGRRRQQGVSPTIVRNSCEQISEQLSEQRDTKFLTRHHGACSTEQVAPNKEDTSVLRALLFINWYL